MPSVTVVMPVYNGERYLREAIASVLAQTFRDFEFLILDDGSTDRSAEMVEAYRDPRIRLIRQATHRGLVETLNQGFAIAGGQFVARMDADDRARPQRLERQVKRMQDDDRIGLVGCGVEVIDAHGRRRPRFRLVADSHELVCWQLLFENCIAHSSVMVRREAVMQIGGYRQGSWSEDYDLWVRMSRCYRMVQLPEVLQQYRLHPDSVLARDGEQHEAWRLRVMGEQATHVLGRPVSPGALDGLRRLSRYEPLLSAATVSETAALIRTYVQRVTETRTLTPAGSRRLRADAGARLMALAGLNLTRFPGPALRVVLSTCGFSPQSLFHRYAARGLWRGVAGRGADAWLTRTLTR